MQADAPLPGGGGGSLAVDPEEHYGASGAGPSSGGCEAPLVGARRGPPTPAPAPAPAPYSGAGPNIVVAGPMPGEEFEKMTLPIPAPEPNPMEGTHIDQEPPDPAKHRQQWANIFQAISTNCGRVRGAHGAIPAWPPVLLAPAAPGSGGGSRPLPLTGRTSAI